MQILAIAVGRRKEAVAQIQIIKGTGKFIINNKPAEQYLQNNACALIAIKSPFSLCQLPDTSSTHLSPNEALVGTVLHTDLSSSDSDSDSSDLKKKDLQKKGKKSESESEREDNFSPVPATEEVVSATGMQVQELVKINTNDTSSDSDSDSDSDSNFQLNFDRIDTIVKVKGGGLMGQTDAIKLGVARAICSINDFSLFSPVATLSRQKGKVILPLVGPTTNSESESGEVDTALVMTSLSIPWNKVEVQNEASSFADADADANAEQVNSATEELTQDVTKAISALQDAQKLLKTKGYLTQDSRVKERRKYGLKKARKASQYHKR